MTLKGTFFGNGGSNGGNEKKGFRLRLVQTVEKREKDMAGRRRHENGKVVVVVDFNHLDARRQREDIGEITLPSFCSF